MKKPYIKRIEVEHTENPENQKIADEIENSLKRENINFKHTYFKICDKCGKKFDEQDKPFKIKMTRTICKECKKK